MNIQNSGAHIPTGTIKMRKESNILSKGRDVYYSGGTSDKGPSEIGTTSLQTTLVAAPC